MEVKAFRLAIGSSGRCVVAYLLSVLLNEAQRSFRMSRRYDTVPPWVACVFASGLSSSLRSRAAWIIRWRLLKVIRQRCLA
eukprot:4213739-Pleurochrysis_carterae.AAC.1